MKILVIADEESPYLWDYYQPGRLSGIDMIISCGDLDRHYLEFLVTMSNVPLLYVPGNHDKSYIPRPPEGCECLDDRLIECKGLHIMGLGGCIRYNHGVYQYTDKEMARRINRLVPRIMMSGGVDIVVTHAPPPRLWRSGGFRTPRIFCFRADDGTFSTDVPFSRARPYTLRVPDPAFCEIQEYHHLQFGRLAHR